MPDAIDSLVEHDGRTLAVRDVGGGGPDVLLLHGMGGSLEDLDRPAVVGHSYGWILRAVLD